MRVVFLYGPPAVGKLTVAQILAQKIGYKLLHNHLLVNPIAEVFPVENPINRLLVREFRLRILEEAAKSNINLIATFGITGNDPFSHIADVVNTLKLHGGTICLVHLTTNEETLLNRLEEESRKINGKDLSKEKLKELLKENQNMFDKFAKEEHLTIDTTEKLPVESATNIIKYYRLNESS